MAGAKVLLVDDEVDFTEVLAERMRTRGMTVDVVDSGMAALGKVKERGYDAIILDLAMPEMDGIETLQRVLAINPDLQVILLTGRATLEKAVQAVKLGAVEFLEKPADIKVLVEKIETAQKQRLILTEKRLDERIKGVTGKKGW
jgi:DNA-binding NtrC family response regulator